MIHYVDRKSKPKRILPFATSAKGRIKDFTKDMEMAAILYLAESNREKGEGRIMKKPDEKLVFIAEACYPVWLIPWNGGILLFDGLGVTAHTLRYDTLPDMQAFNKDIQKNAKTPEAYSLALSRNSNCFKNFVGKEEKTIEGLITSPDFIKDFSVYLSKLENIEEPLISKTLLSPIIAETEISTSIEELSDLRSRIDKDVENINASMTLLNTTTREKTREIRQEINEVRKKFDTQIEKAKPGVTKKIRQIQDMYSEKIKMISRQAEKRLQLLNKDRAKNEKMQKRLKTEIKHCEAKIKSCKRRKKKRTEIQWTQRLKRVKKKLPNLEKNIRDTNKNIKKLETAEKLRILQQKTGCDTRIEKAMKILRELEAAREAEIKMKRLKITSLKDATSVIINQMNEMAKSKKAALSEFDRISMPEKKRACALVYLPFYLARYEMEGKRRYAVYPPSVVGDMGIMTKMKGVLGAAKMRAFLRPRSEALTAFLNQLITLFQENPMFEKEVTEAGIQDSVLGIRQLRIGVKRGLRELENEKWISKNELQTFSKLLYIYA